jgi:2-phospho-L-lactate guanylyltransferase
VPVKPLTQAKSRLADALTPAQRRVLVLGLLQRTLTTLRRTEGVTGVLVVSADPEIWAAADAAGAAVFQEPDAPGLNRSLARAATEVQARGAEALCVVPGDLPGLRPRSLAALTRSATPPPMVGIAPDRHRRGTNALLVTPPDLIPFHFGPNSFARHRRAAQAAGARLVIHDDPDLAWDVDVPEDLAHWPALRTDVETKT